MRVAAFIPARGGSKRLPGKNLMEVNGASLLERAIRCALACHSVTVSTDHEGIAQVGASLVVEAAAVHSVGFFETRAEFGRAVDRQLAWTRYAVNRVPTVPDRSDLCAEIDAWYQGLAEKPDAIAVLNPTSPLRTRQHVAEAIALLESTPDAGGVVSVLQGHEAYFGGQVVDTETGHLWAPLRSLDGARRRTQDLGHMGREQGAIFLVRAKEWEAHQRLVGWTFTPYPMSRRCSMDIDDLQDLEDCDAIARVRGL